MIASLISWAASALVLAESPEAQAVDVFKNTCLLTFPDFSKTRTEAEAAGWTTVPTSRVIYKVGDLLLPPGAVHLRKAGYDVVMEDSPTLGHSCRLHVNLGKRMTPSRLGAATATGLNLPPIVLDAKQTEVEWRFRDGRTITSWQPSPLNKQFFIIIVATPPIGK